MAEASNKTVAAVCRIKKIAVSIITALAAIILILGMFPSLILGNSAESDAIEKNQNETPIEIGEAINKINEFISTEHLKISDKINWEISGMPENADYEIEDVSGDSISAEEIVAMYCSANNSWGRINTENFANLLECSKNKLFTYDKQTTDGGDCVYTVIYTGDEYFREVFGINEEKTDCAHIYAVNAEKIVPKAKEEKTEKEQTLSKELPVRGTYNTAIQKYAGIYGISGFERLIYAVMMAESGGRGTDVMQCSECPYNAKYPHSPNSITDINYSLQVGIQYLASCMNEAGCRNPNDISSISLAIQGYNYGNGYIEWAKKNYGGYSKANAKEFSEMMKTKLGWSGYGNPNYVSDVLKFYYSTSKSSTQKFGSPFPGKVWQSAVTSEYGYRSDPVTGETNKFHAGIDIAYPSGTDISAVGSGTVETVMFSDSGYGYHVIVNHGNGFKTLYGHCSAICVKQGDKVSKGQVIAKVGSTGKSTGAHLHLNVYVNGNTVNPRKYIS